VGEISAADGEKEPWSQQVMNVHITAFQWKTESYIYCGVLTKLRECTWNSRGQNTQLRIQPYSLEKGKRSAIFMKALYHIWCLIRTSGLLYPY